MRKIYLWVIGLLAVAYIVFSFTELKSILAVLRQSKPLYLLIAILVEAVLLLNTTATFLALYRLVGLTENPLNLLLMVTAATFVNLVTPFSGIGGITVFLAEARRRKLSTGRVVVAGVLYILYEYVALFVALVAGFFVLSRLGKLHVAELLAAFFLLALAGSIAVGLIVGYRSTRRLGSLLAWLASRANRLLHPFLHRDYFNIDSVYNFAIETNDGLSTLRVADRPLALLPVAFTLFNKVLLILILALAFLALGVPFNGETLVAGFSIGHLFVYASPTPSGIGFVDGILPMALNSLDVPLPGAVLVTLVYRAVTLWLPLVLGAIAFRILQRSHLRR